MSCSKGNGLNSKIVGIREGQYIGIKEMDFTIIIMQNKITVFDSRTSKIVVRKIPIAGYNL